jgi:hypothetical protein
MEVKLLTHFIVLNYIFSLRFTNIRKIFPKEIVYNESSLENQVKPITPEEAALITPFLQPFIFPDCVQSYIVMLNGKYEPNLSNFSRISSELYIETFSHGTISTNSLLEKLSSEKQPAIVRDLFEKIPDLRVNVYQSYGSDCLTALNLVIIFLFSFSFFVFSFF